jgi:3-oxoacid CoA-transferase subunit A
LLEGVALPEGQTLAVGGFGLCGIPEALIAACATGRHRADRDLQQRRRGRLRPGPAAATRQIRKMISSYVGENKEFERQYLAGELELEFNPQGTLAERLRAGGAGIPAFFTATGYGTIVAEGKETREFDGKHYVLETALKADVSLVKAWKADKAGNLVFRKTARNFNPACAMAGKVCVAEVEESSRSARSIPTRCTCPASTWTASWSTHAREAHRAAHRRAGGELRTWPGPVTRWRSAPPAN